MATSGVSDTVRPAPNHHVETSRRVVWGGRPRPPFFGFRPPDARPRTSAKTELSRNVSNRFVVQTSRAVEERRLCAASPDWTCAATATGEPRGLKAEGVIAAEPCSARTGRRPVPTRSRRVVGKALTETGTRSPPALETPHQLVPVVVRFCNGCLVPGFCHCPHERVRTARG